MLSSLALIRAQNSNDQTDSLNVPNDQQFKSTFLPANSYPMQTPGFTVHWTDTEAKIIRRIENAAKIVFNTKVTELPVDLVFDCVPLHEKKRRGAMNKSNSGLFKNLTSWLFKWPSSSQTSGSSPSLQNSTSISKVIPLMFDSTLFDVLFIFKRGPCYGFSRVRQFTFGKDHCISSLNAFIPALAVAHECRFVQWKTFLIAVETTANKKLRYINLMKLDAEWMEFSIPLHTILSSIDNLTILCHNKIPDSQRAVLFLESIENEASMVFIEIEIFNEFELQFKELKEFKSGVNLPIKFGYFEGDKFLLGSNKSIFKFSLTTGKFTSIFSLQDHQEIEPIVYLFPWGQDLKVSSLYFVLEQRKDQEGLFNEVISIYSLDHMDELTLLHEFRNFKCKSRIRSIFATSSLELFMMDGEGNVFIYSGLLQSTDWHNFGGIRKIDSFDENSSVNRQNPVNQVVYFEFAKWFNILGDDFPFKSEEFYMERRKNLGMDSLFIDDALKRIEGVDLEFPPKNWKELSRICSQLDQNDELSLIFYFLMASGASTRELQLFSSKFGLTASEISMFELAYSMDHGEGERTVKIFCTRKQMAQKQKSFLIGDISSPLTFKKLVRMLKGDELRKLSQFAAGRLVSIDTLLEDDGEVIKKMFEVMLCGCGFRVSLEWIRGLFAWLRPDDRCALIPVGLLHGHLLKRLIKVLLEVESNSRFKELGSEFVEKVQLDPEMLIIVLKYLISELESGKGNNDRSAWILTMLCASRGRLHGFLLKYDFSLHVNDPEVLEGIERIKELIKPLIPIEGEGNIEPNNELVNEDQEEDLIMKIFGKNENSCNEKNSNICTPSKQLYKKSHSINLLEIYSRTPTSSPRNCFSFQQNNNNSPTTFSPRHFPSKLPTKLSTINRKESASDKGEVDEEEDPFRADLMRFNGKRPYEVEMDLKTEMEMNNDDDCCSPKILTKEPVRVVDPVDLTLKGSSRKRQRRHKK